MPTHGRRPSRAARTRSRPTSTSTRRPTAASTAPGFALAGYDCRDFGGSGLKRCEGDVPAGTPFDTETPGEKTFTVTAFDGEGNTTTRTVHYRVVPVNHQLTLASRAEGTTVSGADGDSTAVAIAGDYVLFESAATNLGFPSGARNVYRRNVAGGVTVAVTTGRTDAHALGLSADGRFVLFTTEDHLYLRDVQSATTTLIDHAFGKPAQPANGALGTAFVARTAGRSCSGRRRAT